MSVAERTLDVLLSAGASSTTFAADAVASCYTRLASASAVASVRQCTVREAAAISTSHVVVTVASPQGLAQDVRAALASRNAARDLAGRRLRLHVLVESDAGESGDLLEEVARESRGRRIILWTPPHRQDDRFEEAVKRHQAKILGRVDWRDEPDADRTFAKTLENFLSIDQPGRFGLDGSEVPNVALTGSKSTPELTHDRAGESTATLLRTTTGASNGTRESVLEERLEQVASRLATRLNHSLERFEAHIVESAEHRFATRLESMATTWVGYVQSSVVDATSRFIERTNAAFGARAEHFTQRLEVLSQDEMGRDRRFQEVVRGSVVRTLREEVERRLDMKSRWFGVGALACGLCMVAGLAIGLAIPRVLG